MEFILIQMDESITETSQKVSNMAKEKFSTNKVKHNGASGKTASALSKALEMAQNSELVQWHTKATTLPASQDQ